MITQFTLAAAILNPVVGDVPGNLRKIQDARAQAAKLGADLVLTSELATAGYPPEDLVLKPAFQRAIHAAVDVLLKDDGPDLLVSTPWVVDGKVMSSVLLISDHRIAGITHKVDLPNYGPFDEKRVFTAGPMPEPILWRGVKLGVPICEDIWQPGVCAHIAAQGADMFIVPNGSPYEHKKENTREELVATRARDNKLPMVYHNQVGGQDELVFDGGLIAADAEGNIVGRSAHWQAGVQLVRLEKLSKAWKIVTVPQEKSADGLGSIYAALVTGLRDYVEKNRFPGVVLGMSGGIDSALCAALATDALGADRVRCIMMPSPYTSRDSLEDAESCAKALGCSYESINIGPAMEAYEQMLGGTKGITSENIQSRARGVTLMGISNTTGLMVLSTGNKSEMSVGYATLYGDMCGGFSGIKDVYKTTVFALCQWRNQNTLSWGKGPAGEVITPRIISKPPSAELRPDQKDEDSLPPYPVLDGILKGLVEKEQDIPDLVAEGYEKPTIQRVWKLLDRAEYKRRQSAPGVKITPRSFGKDRRYPITNGFTDTIA